MFLIFSVLLILDLQSFTACSVNLMNRDDNNRRYYTLLYHGATVAQTNQSLAYVDENNHNEESCLTS